MKKWFNEKVHQIDNASITAFGVTLETRYGNANEMIEMLSFVRDLAYNNLESNIKEIFYDTNACICNITFIDGLDQFSEESLDMLKIAKKHISQFDWFGFVQHKE